MTEPTQGAEPQGAGRSPGGEDSTASTGADTPKAGNAAPADTGGGGDNWQAKFEEAKQGRDAQKARSDALEAKLEGLTAGLAGLVGVAPPQGDDDPAVANKRLSDEVAELKRGLAKERVLRGVADTSQAEIILAGLEATGAISLSTTDPTAIAAIETHLRDNFSHLFEVGEVPRAPRKKAAPAPIPAPRNGVKKGPEFHPSVIAPNGQRLI